MQTGREPRKVEWEDNIPQPSYRSPRPASKAPGNRPVFYRSNNLRISTRVARKREQRLYNSVQLAICRIKCLYNFCGYCF